MSRRLYLRTGAGIESVAIKVVNVEVKTHGIGNTFLCRKN